MSDEIELKNGKANGFGWSTYDLFHGDLKIGTVYCGEPTIDHPDYSHRLGDEPNGDKRLFVFTSRAKGVPVMDLVDDFEMSG